MGKGGESSRNFTFWIICLRVILNLPLEIRRCEIFVKYLKTVIQCCSLLSSLHNFF